MSSLKKEDIASKTASFTVLKTWSLPADRHGLFGGVLNNLRGGVFPMFGVLEQAFLGLLGCFGVLFRMVGVTVEMYNKIKGFVSFKHCQHKIINDFP